MNLKLLQARGWLAALKLLPPATRDQMIFEALQKGLDAAGGGPIGLGMAIGVIRDALPSDPMVTSSFNIFAEELWRWYRDRGGR